ncbi:MAG: glycosyltransferase family 4 protein [Spirochaetales bacterium]|nr:glycosyltransferase family 4 protein [Spirochaetales bacterium]
MIKVGFYIKNKHTPDVDITKPEYGNPGMGGSQFTGLALAYYINNFFKDRIEVTVLANQIKLLPRNLKTVKADTCLEAAQYCKKNELDIFVFKSRSDEMGFKLYDFLDTHHLKAIAKSNNTPEIPALNRIAESPFIKRHVCVSQEQLDQLRDHTIFSKSKCIFNVFNPKHFIPKAHIKKNSNAVVYIGSIIPAKGFHVVARIWKSVLKKIPEAKLIVIGGGNLYNRKKQVGTWGIAEEKYERIFRPYLSDKNGAKLNSVEFKGILGSEKIKIIQEADVGIANPTGISENCPASALEIQACGTPIVSGPFYGMLDTIQHGKTGLLGKTDKELVNYIVYLLKNPNLASKLGNNGIGFIQDKFSPQKISSAWVEMFNNIMKNKNNVTEPVKQNLFYDHKYIREFLRIIKKKLPCAKIIPSLVELKYYLKNHLKKI